MDPINYVPLVAAESPTPVCIICGQRSPFMFFPCGCTHPIHGKCLPIWRQHKGMCPGCKAVWIDVVQASVETTAPVHSCDYKCIVAFLCCMIMGIGLGAVYMYNSLHGKKY
jgi:hypothetical protein